MAKMLKNGIYYIDNHKDIFIVCKVRIRKRMGCHDSWECTILEHTLFPERIGISVEGTAKTLLSNGMKPANEWIQLLYG